MDGGMVHSVLQQSLSCSMSFGVLVYWAPFRSSHSRLSVHFNVYVDHWNTSKDVKLAQEGQGHHVNPGPTKRDTMLVAIWDAKL